MQPTSETYKALLAAGAPKEYRALIYRTSSSYNIYNNTKIVSATTRSAMLDSKLTIGNCIAKELHLVLRNISGMPTIPRMAQIRMQFRLNDETTQSEWLPKGTFFIDTRDESYGGVLTIDAFDPMLKAEQSFTQPGNQGQWPRSDITVINQIATRIGVTVDARTTAIITNNYQIPYPGYGEGAYTCREILGYIGTMYGGNWIITDENKLRLIILGDIPPGDTNLLVDQLGNYITIGGYRIIVSR